MYSHAEEKLQSARQVRKLSLIRVMMPRNSYPLRMWIVLFDGPHEKSRVRNWGDEVERGRPHLRFGRGWEPMYAKIKIAFNTSLIVVDYMRSLNRGPR